MSQAADKHYAVGRGKPPVHTRFKKGQSGNPFGRRAKHQPFAPRPNPTRASDGVAAVALKEAYRLVTIREGDKIVRVPAIVAVLRAQFALAVKGNRLAQRDYLRKIQGVEDDKYQAKISLLKDAAEYKHDALQMIEKRKRLGLGTEDILPHPDHILIDEDRGDVYIAGKTFPQDALLVEVLRLRAEIEKKKRKRKPRQPRSAPKQEVQHPSPAAESAP